MPSPPRLAAEGQAGTATSAAAGAAFDFEQLAPAPREERPVSVSEAKSRAQAIVAAAQAEADRIRNEARQEGYAEGLVAGRAELRATAEPVVDALSHAIEELRALQLRAADLVEREAVVLAVEVAEKVVAGALEVEPERVLDVVRGALRALVERERVVIQVNPEDMEIVREGLDELRGSLGGMEHVDVQEERRVPRGGAVVRTTVGEIDARIRTKLDRAKDAAEAELAT
jgi:flagellar biosynthesis/type III secretory pathway protein FliH